MPRGGTMLVTMRCAGVLLAAAMVLLLNDFLSAAEISKATTSRKAKEEAIESIPFDKLDEATQAKLYGVVSNPSMYRRMPLQITDCDPQLYLFLVRHPEIVVNIWDLMGITKVSLKRVGPFSVDAIDGSGTVSRVDLVYGTPEIHILYAQGTYQGRLLKQKVTGRCVLVLKSWYSQADDGRVQITSQLDLFVQFDQAGADLLAKTLHPLVGRSADYNFSESTNFLGRISREAELNGPGMSLLATKLTKVDPAIRQKFAQLTTALSHKASLKSSPPSAGVTQAASNSSSRQATPSSFQR